MSAGVVIGKFLPPHRGHGLLIETARAHCEKVAVIVCDASWHDVDGDVRARWIAQSFPQVETRVVDQDALGLDDDDTAGWARVTLDVLGRPPDVVFTSEDYGPRYAALMGAEHVMVDRERHAIPARAREIRARPQAHLDLLEPHVRAHYVARVCILGAESTGKTTLARDLAEHYRVGFVPEFGRVYTEAMPAPPRYGWKPRDFHLIAEAQAAIEDDTARWTPPPLICDTNPFVTGVFHEAYLGARAPEIEAVACRRRYDLFLLCDPATPFEQDGTLLRQDGDRRRWMHQRYHQYADSQPGTRVDLTGTREQRLATAIDHVDRLLSGPKCPRQGSNLRASV